MDDKELQKTAEIIVRASYQVAAGYILSDSQLAADTLMKVSDDTDTIKQMAEHIIRIAKESEEL